MKPARNIILWTVLFLLPAHLSLAADDDFVEIIQLDSTIIIDLKYATPNNFVGQVLYDSDRCFLRQVTAERLVRVQRALQKRGLGLKIWDGYRPHSVQFKMWELVPNPDFVGNPYKGSRHNRGAAVDVTLVDSLGNELEMPTPFDDFTDKARRRYKKLPPHILKNRQILEDAMKAQGFIPLTSEWWHFDDPNWKKFKLENISIKELAKRVEKKDERNR